MPTTDIQVSNLKINVLTEEQYEQIQNPSNTELYLVPEVVDTVPTENSTNTITSGAVYDAVHNAKTIQTPVTDPTASGTSITFIDSIAQDANGEITPTKKTVQSASPSSSGVGGQAGLMSAADKEKLDSIASGAEVNVQSDWNQTNSNADDFIKSKPIELVKIINNNGTYTCDKSMSDFANMYNSSKKPLFYVTDSNNENFFGFLQADSASYFTDSDFCFNLITPSESNGLYELYVVEASSSTYPTVTHSSNRYSADQVNSDWNASSGVAQILNKPTIPDAVSGTNDGTNWTSLTIGSVTKNIPSGGGGGLTNYDFTHTANQSVSGSVTVTYAANTRGSRMVTASADLSVTFAVNNSSDNYLWIKNTGSSDIDILISSVTYNNSSVSNVYMPDDGITVPAGKVCEIGIVCNADGAFITSRSDLSL